MGLDNFEAPNHLLFIHQPFPKNHQNGQHAKPNVSPVAFQDDQNQKPVGL